jgi:sugar phosphate isomerase/epimerase
MSHTKASVQLYSAARELTADFDGTLARIAALGLRNVEAFGFVGRAAEIGAALERHELHVPTGHAWLASTTVRHGETVIDVPSCDVTFDSAAELGMATVFEPFVPPERWTTRADVARTAELLNLAAARAATFGLRVGYHNHSHEFVADFGGRSAYECFVADLDEVVCLELDVYWASIGGEDVPALIDRLGPRLTAIHVKDGPLVDEPFASGAPLDPSSLGQVPAGMGEIPLDAIVAASSSVDYAVIEFDHFDGDIIDGIGASADYLRTHGIT